MKTETTEIDLYGVKLNVEYSVSGIFIPATRYQPAEFPEIEIIKITDILGEQDLKTILGQYHVDIYNLIISKSEC